MNDIPLVDLVPGECRTCADSNSCPNNEIKEFAFHAITCELIILEIDWEAQPVFNIEPSMAKSEAVLAFRADLCSS